MDEALRDIPRSWDRALFQIACEQDPELFWRRVVDLIAKSIGFEVIVVDWNFSTFMVRKGSDDISHNTVLSHQLTLGKLYTELHTAYGVGARRHGVDEIGRTTLLTKLGALGPPITEAIALVFEAAPETAARIVLYRAGVDDGADDLQMRLEQLHKALAIVLAGMSDRVEQTRLSAAMTGYLRDIPIGLVFASWNGGILFANDEGWRQAWIWTTAPRRESFKTMRGRFALPPSLRAGLDDLKCAWIEALRSDPHAPVDVVQFSHPAEPALRATASLVQDVDQPLLTPNFALRFPSAHSQALNQAFEPSPTQFKVLAALTPTERHIATLVAQGLSNKEIAQSVGREISTVKDHLTRIYDKLGVPGRARLLRLLNLSAETAPSVGVEAE